MASIQDSISDKVNDLGGYLREQRVASRLSVRQLATLAGVSNPYLSQVERGLRKPSAEVLQQIAKGLQISAEALYVKAGILDAEGRLDVEAAIASDPDLTDRQRWALLDIYHSFKAENSFGQGRRGEVQQPRLMPAAESVRPDVSTLNEDDPTSGEPLAAAPARKAAKKSATTSTKKASATKNSTSAPRSSGTTRKTATKKTSPRKSTSQSTSKAAVKSTARKRSNVNPKKSTG